MSDPPDAPIRGPQHQSSGPIVVASRPNVPNRSLLSPFSKNNHRSSSRRAPLQPHSVVPPRHSPWWLRARWPASLPCLSTVARLNPSPSRAPDCPPSALSTAPSARRGLLQLTDHLLHRCSDTLRRTCHGLLNRSARQLAPARDRERHHPVPC
jgi:hypothetical protein